MAEANTDPTRPSSKWVLIVEDLISTWHDRTGSSRKTMGAVKALLCDPETQSARRRVDASWKEIPGTASYVDDPEFWRDRLKLIPDPNGGDEHLVVDYSEYGDIYWDHDSPGWRWEGFVRQLDMARHERLYPELAAPLPTPIREPAPPSAPSEELSNKPRQKPGPKPDFEWEKIEAECYDLMHENGDFTPDDPDWDCRARLEEALMDYCQNTWSRQPAPATLREKLPRWLSTWHKRKTGA